MKVEQNPIAQSLLEQIRQHQQQISETRIEAGFEVDSKTNQVNFSELVGSALDEVNALKKSSAASAAAYESGVDIPLSDVMVNMQKASLAFEATLQVRNKVLKAYEDIMNMPV
ncbi:MAG: flagellar hook-basal body complex protein FliE [Halieaceae bacterium]|nr:flagellar hook-basal body complex protein FliE [Halieaceae bacterium]